MSRGKVAPTRVDRAIASRFLAGETVDHLVYDYELMMDEIQDALRRALVLRPAT